MPWEEKWRVDNQDGENRVRRGGQGRISRVSEIDGNRVGALKRSIRRRSTERQKKRFYDEVYNLTATHRAGGRVPELYDHNMGEVIGDQTIEPYFVCEFISGPTLQEYLDEFAPIGLREAAQLVLPILSTVRLQIEDLKLLHRDLKPNNIILRHADPSDPIIVDYGLSTSYEQRGEDNSPLWEEIGNRFMVFPEKIREGEKRDERTEINSIAGLFYAALTGHRPGIVIDEHGVLPHRREGREIPTNGLSGELAQAVNHFLDRAFNPNIGLRFQNVDEIEIPLVGFSEERIPPEVMNEAQLAEHTHWEILNSNRDAQLDFFTGAARDIRNCFDDVRNKFDRKPFVLSTPEYTAAARGEFEPARVQSPILRLSFRGKHEVDAVFAILIRGSDVVLLKCETTEARNQNTKEIFSMNGFERPTEDQLRVYGLIFKLSYKISLCH